MRRHAKDATTLIIGPIALVGTFLAALLALALAASPASALYEKTGTIETNAGQLTSFGTVYFQGGVAVDPSSGELFTAYSGTGTVSPNGPGAIETFNADGSPGSPSVFGEGPFDGVAVDPVSHNLYVFGGTSVTTFNPATGAVIGSPFAVPAADNAQIATDSAGNVYLPSTAQNRLEKYSSSGVLQRAVGYDVVSAGPGDAGSPEVQTVTVKAASGAFTLTFASQTTAPLAHNASAATVQAALNGLSSIGGAGGSVSVTGGPGDATGSTPYTVTFGGALSSTNVAQITINATQLGVAVGAQLTCTAGPESATTKSFQWLRNGAPIGGATSSTYTTTAPDAGTALQCQTFAINANAGSTQVSNPVNVVSPFPATAPPVAPGSISSPAQSAALTVGGGGGQTLTCAPATWTGSPTFAYQWYRNGVALAGNGADTSIYTVQAADVAEAAAFQCVVTATNAGGSTAKASSNRLTSPSPSPSAPSATANVAALSSTATTATGTPGYEVCVPANGDVCKAGVAGGGGGQLAAPTDVAVDSTGNVYVADDGNDRVVKYSPDGATHSDFTSSPGATQVSGIDIDRTEDTVFVGIWPEGGSFGISKFDSSGAQIDRFGEGDVMSSFYLGTPPRIAVDPDTDDVYVSQGPGPEITVFSLVPPPTLVVNPANVTGQSTATLSGSMNPHGQATEGCFFEYADNPAFTDSEFAACDPLPATESAPVAVSAALTGLATNTEYSYRLLGETDAGDTSSVTQTFTTLPNAPAVATQAASGITQTAAVLHGTVDANGNASSCAFEYDTSAGFASPSSVPCDTSPVSGDSAVAVNAALAGLTPGTTYHVRVKATNAGGTSNANSVQFTTSPHTCETDSALCPAPPTPPSSSPPAPAPAPSPAPKPPATKPLKCKKGFKKVKVRGKAKCKKIKKAKRGARR